MTDEDLLAGRDEARAALVAEYYGAAFMDELESLAAKYGIDTNMHR